MTLKFTYEDIKETFEKCNGFVSQAAKLLNCDPKTIYNYIERYPELKNDLKHVKNKMIDFAENQLFELIREKDKTAIIFYLKTQAKERGYYEKQEIEQTSISNLNLNLNDKSINAAQEFIKSISNGA